MILDCMLATNYGGTEKVFLDQLQMLPLAGMAVCGVARRGSPAARRAHAQNLPCEEMTVLSEWDPLTRAFARAIVDRHKPSAILCHGMKAQRIFAAAVGGRVPVVAMVHKPGFHKDLPSALFITVAEHRRRFLIAHGAPADKVVTIPNGVPIPSVFKTDYAIAPGRRAKIAAIGRLHEKKGFDVLADALKLLADRGVDFECTILGDGPQRGEIEQRIARYGLGGRVALPGWSDDIASLLMASDVFAFPSFQEDFPLAVLEAMAHGLPIVSSRIDGPKDFLVDGKTALFVEMADAPGLAAGLERLIGDEALRRALGSNARDDAARHYSFPAIGRRLADTLSGVIAKSPRPR
jgi:glycosyltransferase involved in cell wall biosynthesis